MAKKDDEKNKYSKTVLEANNLTTTIKVKPQKGERSKAQKKSLLIAQRKRLTTAVDKYKKIIKESEIKYNEINKKINELS